MAQFSVAGPSHLPGTMPPPQQPSHPIDRRYLARMQELNFQMAKWRTNPGPPPRGQDHVWRAMPIPWRDRAREQPDVWPDLPNPYEAWRLPVFGTPFVKSNRVNKLDQPWTPQLLQNDNERRAFARKEELKAFFERGGAATPGSQQTWKYQRALGYGGNGVAAKFRIFEENPERHRDVAVKVQLRGWRSKGLQEERKFMRMLSHASHAVQESPRDKIGKPPRDNTIPLDWYPDDSSEFSDSSGDEDTPETRPATRKVRKNRRDLTPEELARKQKRWNYDPGPPPPLPPLGPTPDEDKDFIVMEYVENGDLRGLIAKVNDMNTKFPDRVLWSFFLCLVKQCIGMAFYPRKFHPDRKTATEGTDLDEMIPPVKEHWRFKNLVHFDYDPMNIFVGNIVPGSTEHRIVPKLKLADFGLACEVKGQKRDIYYVNRRPLAKSMFYAPEQFGSEWDFIAADRNSDHINTWEPIAGNYGIHTNIWCIGLVMMCLITRRYPLQPPIAALFNFPIIPGNPQRLHYGGTLFNGHWEDVDADLRAIVCLCLAHNPAERPMIGWLQQQIEAALADLKRFPGQDDLRLHAWFQEQVLSAPSLQQEIPSAPDPRFTVAGIPEGADNAV